MRTTLITLVSVLFCGCTLFGNSPKVISGKTPEAAREEIRRLKATHSFPKEGVVVELEGRFVYDKSTFELGKYDGGESESARVTYRGVGRGASFTGGTRIPRSALKECGRGPVLSCNLRDFGIGELKPIPDKIHAWDGMELFAGGGSCTLARYPNEGWLTFNFDDVIDPGTEPDRKRGEWNFGVRGGTFKFPAGDTHPAKWNLENGVWIHGFWACDWASDSLKLDKIDLNTRAMTTKGIHTLGIGPMNHVKHEPRRYFVYNTLDELDAPGEWYVDREERILYYYPREGETGDLLLVNHEAPIMVVNGAQFLTLENISFKCNTDTAAKFIDCDDLVLDRVSVLFATRLGIEVRGGKNALIRKCRSYMTGGNGFNVEGGNRKTLEKCNHRITECDFSRPGRIVSNASALRFAGCGITLDHCYIHDAPYIGVTYGGNDHILEYNEVAFCMMESGDGGGFYTGRDWCSQGTVVRYNYLHHFGKSGADYKLAKGEKLFCEPLKRDDSSGIYLDDCDCGELCVSNVMFKTGRGFLVGGGRDNDIRDNLMVGCEICAISIDDRGTKRLRLGDGTNDGWDMVKKLNAVDWKNGIWAERYPWMADYLDNDPLMPVRTTFTGNVAVNCKNFYNSGWNKERGFFVRDMVGVNNRSYGPRGPNDDKLLPEKDAKGFKNQVKFLHNSALERSAEGCDDARKLLPML